MRTIHMAESMFPGPRFPEDAVDQPICRGAKKWQMGAAGAEADTRDMPAV